MSLQSELNDDPLNRGYSNYIPHAPGILVDMLNERIYTMPKEKFITARSLLFLLGPEIGSTILDKLETAAQSNSAIKWSMKFMLSDGIDIGSTVTRQVLDSLVGTVLTQQEVDAIKDLALQPASRAEVLGLGYVYEDLVRQSLNI